MAHDVQTKVLIFEFSGLETDESASKLKDLLDSVKEDVSVLVNNVGVLHFGRLGDMDI